MVELLSARGVERDGVISLDDVTSLREQMGAPNVFSENENDVDDEPDDKNKPVKRLMRDPDEAVFGGVCAGLAAYLGIDAIWVRLLVIAVAIASLGAAVLAYVVLWIIMPVAKTATDKLQMRGKSATLDAIQNFTRTNEPVRKTANFAVKFLQITLGVALLLLACGALVATIVGGVTGTSIVFWMDAFGAQSWVAGLLVSLIAGGIFLIVLASLMSYSAFAWRIKKSVGVAMIVTLVMSMISIAGMAVFGIQSARELAKDERNLSRTVDVQLPQDLEGVKYVDNDSSTTGLEITNYNDASRMQQPISAKVQYYIINDATPPKIKVERRGDTLYVSNGVHASSQKKTYPF